jgi:hypothetical protein
MEAVEASRGGAPARKRGFIWLGGSLLVGGEIAGAIVGSFHAGGGAKANDNAAVFKKYAESDSWTVVHILQFMAALLIVAGIVVLARALARMERGAHAGPADCNRSGR